MIHPQTPQFFYSGHSGYSNHFLQIKNYVNNVVLKRNNHIDLSILPIGIYKPDSLYNNFHMSPREALQVSIHKNVCIIVCQQM